MINFENSFIKEIKRNPYYIFCPPYKAHSAGILLLHRLCHTLNVMGYPSYLIVDRKVLGKLGHSIYPTSESLITPELTMTIARQHLNEGITPIVILPDTITGNPLNAPIVWRYLLSFPGHLGGNIDDLKLDQYVVSYSNEIRLKAEKGRALFIPISDPDFFTPPLSNEKRKGACHYAAKYKHFFNGEVDPEIAKNTEITRDTTHSQSKNELRNIFRKSELFYCYENTALAIEAALCGCPVVFLPNKHFESIIAKDELGTDGFAWGNEKNEIERAKATVGKFRERYLDSLKIAKKELISIINETQELANKTKYTKMINNEFIVTDIGHEFKIIHKASIVAHKIIRNWGDRGASTVLVIIIKKVLYRLHLFGVAKKFYSFLKSPKKIGFLTILRIIFKKPNSKELPPHIL